MRLNSWAAVALVGAVMLCAIVPAAVADDYWNTSDRLNRRTCPDTSCGIVGALMFREKATVLERRGDWARVTGLYDAACSDGLSPYVSSGDPRCTAANGINEGKFAEWVSMAHLSRQRPADPGAGATGWAALVGQSDDYRIYSVVFATAAQELIEAGRCFRTDFAEWGGWTKSSNHQGPIYFMYCGGSTAGHRVYLDSSSGRTFK